MSPIIIMQTTTPVEKLYVQLIIFWAIFICANKLSDFYIFLSPSPILFFSYLRLLLLFYFFYFSFFDCYKASWFLSGLFFVFITFYNFSHLFAPFNYFSKEKDSKILLVCWVGVIISTKSPFFKTAYFLVSSNRSGVNLSRLLRCEDPKI